MFAAILRASLRISISAKETKPRGTNYAYRDCHASLSGGGPRLAVDGDGYAMTVVDYIAISFLIVGLMYAVVLALKQNKL